MMGKKSDSVKFEFTGDRTLENMIDTPPEWENNVLRARIAELEEELAIVKADYNSMNKIADYIVQVARTIAQERDALSAEMAAIISRAMDQSMSG